ncbi:MAG: hypothetical protein GDA46_07210 [Bdellovibrionales bacterium]|nr:hypothetical protein [Bdellovibrionales bacterium]
MNYRLDKQGWMEEGFEKGRQAEKREQLFKLLELGVNISKLIKVTAFSKIKILKLKKK